MPPHSFSFQWARDWKSGNKLLHCMLKLKGHLFYELTLNRTTVCSSKFYYLFRDRALIEFLTIAHSSSGTINHVLYNCCTILKSQHLMLACEA